MFKVVFVLLFSAACLLNLATAPIKRHVYIMRAHTAFEAIMKFEENPLFERLPTGKEIRHTPHSDAEKYFIQSYCYATGSDGYNKDIPKAVELCQRAASLTRRAYAPTPVEAQAQEILNKAGLSWNDANKWR